MDAEDKEHFRLKFYKLALHLNVVIMLAAVAVIVLVLAPAPYRFLLGLAMALLAVYLAVTFRRSYHETRVWLYEHAGTVQGEKKPP